MCFFFLLIPIDKHVVICYGKSECLLIAVHINSKVRCPSMRYYRSVASAHDKNSKSLAGSSSQQFSIATSEIYE